MKYLLSALLTLTISNASAQPVLTRSGSQLQFGGQPIRLVGYGCYGILTESAFEYQQFFDLLKDTHQINFVRIWLNYHWTNDLTPFAGSRGNHDLLTQNQAYYTRLDAIARYAEQKGIIVQFTFFDSCMLEGGSTSGNRWINNPYRTSNNQQSYCGQPVCVEGTSGEIWTGVNAPFMSRVVDTLKERGNIIYEIANEPYSGAFGSSFHTHAINYLHGLLAQSSVTGSKVIATNDDSLNNVNNPKVDIVAFHLHDPNGADNHGSSAKPVIISNDGDASQTSNNMSNADRASRIRSIANNAFNDGSAVGHTHLEILDKDIHGASWLSQDYNPRVANVTNQILNVVDDYIIPQSGGGDCDPVAGSLSQGQSYTVQVDSHSGDEHTTQPKTDANNGQNGDRVDFRRHNVARAHGNYWYTSNYQEAGEPSPSGPQWVDYTPDFSTLGVGNYQVTIRFRDTGARASYAAHYKVMDTQAGDVLVQQRQDIGEGYHDIDIGSFYMCRNSFVRVEDPGPNSITFNEMVFTYLGGGTPPPPPPPPNCDYPGVGQHTMERFAQSVTGSGDWSNAAGAAGAPDGTEARSPNLDNGEVLSAGTWDFCDPDGEEQILAVEVASYGRTQYEQGPYDILVRLNAGGASSSWHHTQSSWDSVDVTGTRGSWSWSDVNALAAEISLDSHPNGNRDSDVWVDAFRVRVTFETLSVGPDAGVVDTGVVVDAGVVDTGVVHPDASVMDSGTVDAGTAPDATVEQDASTPRPDGATHLDSGSATPQPDAAATGLNQDVNGGCGCTAQTGQKDRATWLWLILVVGALLVRN